MTQAPPPADMKLQRSSRDAATVPGLLADWLAGLLPPDAAPEVVLHAGIDANGMSSETLVVDATWTESGTRDQHEYVARVAPAPEDVPVFETYDLEGQYEAMRLVAAFSDVPVPQVSFMEPTGDVLGTPFFLMDRVAGLIPQDVLPYNFGDNWLFDADPADQRRLQDATVATIAALHAIPNAASTFSFLNEASTDPQRSGESPLARNLARTRAWYDFAVTDIGRSPLAERGLDWLEAHLAEAEEQGSGDTVLCWGDSRIGNVVYTDFEPAAVLDWEMATTGPRELDLSWLVFAHQVFESITNVLDLPGMPHFLREQDVVATYESITGVSVGDLTWFHVYNAVQWCVVFMRTGARSVHFGEIEPPDDLETLMHHKGLMESILERASA